jgi:inosine-uridine nucleoside N-ribohydrolase
MSARRPFLIDLGADSGASLGLALAAVAAAEEIEIVGVAAYDRATRESTLGLARKLGIDAPAACGSGRLLVPSACAGPLETEAPAHRVIYEAARTRPGELEILALGPLSNLARAFLARADLAALVKRIYLRGGAHGGGDATPAAEGAIHADPEAAKVVFESGVPVVMVGLDVAPRARLSSDEARELLGGERAWLSPSGGPVEALGLAALVAALDEDAFSFRDCHVDVETRGRLTYGKTACDVDNPRRGRLNAKVALGLDRGRYIETARRLLA